MNFSMPFLKERFGEEVLEAGAMSAEYEQQLAEIAALQAGKPESDYVEPTVPELVALMEEIPLNGEDWF